MCPLLRAMLALSLLQYWMNQGAAYPPALTSILLKSKDTQLEVIFLGRLQPREIDT
jgi:hypothetical protein